MFAEFFGVDHLGVFADGFGGFAVRFGVLADLLVGVIGSCILSNFKRMLRHLQKISYMSNIGGAIRNPILKKYFFRHFDKSYRKLTYTYL